MKAKYIGSLLLAALMLATTIGIGIYEHTCFMTGHKGVSIFMVGEASGTNEATSCCAVSQGACKKPAGDATRKGCCEETGAYYQLDIPTKSEEHFAYQAPLLPALDLIALPEFDFTVAVAAYTPQYSSLPPPETGQRLASLQVYRL